MIDRQLEGNPYYDPEACGLEWIGKIEDEPDYDFNILMVVQDVATGRVFYAQDSGCSCPSPFEDYHTLSAFTEVTLASLEHFKDVVLTFGSGPSLEQRAKLIRATTRVLESCKKAA